MSDYKAFNFRLKSDIAEIVEQRAKEEEKTIYSFLSEKITAEILKNSAVKNEQIDRLKNIENLLIDLVKYAKFSTAITAEILRAAKPAEAKTIFDNLKEKYLTQR